MENMKLKMKNKPKTKKELEKMIKAQFKRKCYDLNNIDTSEITDMSELFRDICFNFNISKWNTENVENMEGMFWYCDEFNCDISGWDTRKVRDMRCMFWNCTKFNQDIGKWNTGEVVNMSWMFFNCTSFNQDLSSWSIRKATISEYNNQMLYECLIKDEWKPKYWNLYCTD